MLISHAYKFIYTKTVKTASTSVELFLQPFIATDSSASEQTPAIETVSGVVGYRGGDPRGQKWFNHMSLHEISTKLDADRFKAYFKFCCVRNPFDKLLSAFLWFEPGARDAAPPEQVAAFRSWLNYDSLTSDWRTASVFDRDKYVLTNGEIGIDFFIRYERLQDDLSRVLSRLNMPGDPSLLPRLKSTSRSGVRTAEFYGETEIALINDWYDYEFNLFGYDRRPQPA